MDKFEFPDQIYIDKIKERLWCGREFGQASVMIGSGFSKNAEKKYSTTPELPLWPELENKLAKELYNDETKTSIGALNLGTEYELTFGRSELDDFLLKEIPYKEYIPGKLHKMLLTLPWSDVFTTNYDNLLEDTEIDDRKYDLILTKKDIPGRMQPRIVKLHGSFPSHRPFIFTEDDYRCYPTNFAPFVNMMQQSLMENIFCLIGFSGNDPNFLNWIGWVRDNLKESMPRIYLCGCLNLTNPAKKRLDSLNIIPIDLSVLPIKSINKHSLALEWFLFNLMEGERFNELNWPEPNRLKKELFDKDPQLPYIPINTSNLRKLDYKDYDPFLN